MPFTHYQGEVLYFVFLSRSCYSQSFHSIVLMDAGKLSGQPITIYSTRNQSSLRVELMQICKFAKLRGHEVKMGPFLIEKVYWEGDSLQ